MTRAQCGSSDGGSRGEPCPGVGLWINRFAYGYCELPWMTGLSSTCRNTVSLPGLRRLRGAPIFALPVRMKRCEYPLVWSSTFSSTVHFVMHRSETTSSVWPWTRAWGRILTSGRGGPEIRPSACERTMERAGVSISFNNGQNPGRIHWGIGATRGVAARLWIFDRASWAATPPKRPATRIGERRYLGQLVTLWCFPDFDGQLEGHDAAFASTALPTSSRFTATITTTPTSTCCWQ